MEEEGGGSFPLTPTQGTYVIGAINLIGAILAIAVVQMLGRRTIFIFGQLLMSLTLFVCGLMVIENQNLTTIVMLYLFMATF